MIPPWTAALMFALGQAAAAPESPPTFGAESQVVVLDVVARDSRGRPVTDLRPDEIQVFEDGQACAIVSFRLVQSLAREPEDRPAPGRSVASAGAEPAEAPSRANLVVLLFDVLSVENAAAARRGVLALLSQPFPRDTWFAVYKVDRSMRLLQAFTSDPKQLVAAVESATSGDEAHRVAGAPAPSVTAPAPPAGGTGLGLPAGPDLPGQPPDQVVQVAAGVQGEVEDLARRVNAMDSLYAIRALARGLGAVRGRKTILYLAEDREITQSADAVYDSTIDAANRANVTVHTVDSRGLALTRPGDLSAFGRVPSASDSTSPPLQAGVAGGEFSRFQPTDGPGGPMMDRQATLANPVQGSFLEHMALDTGGLAIAGLAGTNELGAGLARIIEEVGQYYEVVYEPARPEPDGRFRRIIAKAARKGVRLRTRSGYYATPGNSPTVAAFELPLLAAIGAAEPPRDFEHAATVMHFAAAGREREALFIAEVPLRHATIVEDEGRGTYRAQLALLGFVRDESGRTVARFSQDWPIEGPLADRAKLGETRAMFRRAFTLPPGGYTLITAIQDREADRTSVEHHRFDVPPAGGGLAAGSLAVVRNASGDPSTDADPLRVGGVTIAPHVGTGALPLGTKSVALFLPIYPSLSSSPVELKLEVWRAGEQVAVNTAPLSAPGPDGRIPWIGSLPAEKLPPGTYEVVAQVRQGDAVAEERASFDLRERIAIEPLAVAPPGTPRAVPPDVVPLLEAAARYVLEYESSFQNLAADETYTQSVSAAEGTRTMSVGPHLGISDELLEATTLSCAGGYCRRTSRAEIVFARLAGAVPWGCFRDVYEVGGRKVRDPGRLEALFTKMPFMSATQRATALLAESARYNFGPAVRNINFPTLALAFLHPMNQGRFAWSRGGTRRFGAVEGVEVQFEEIDRPTIVDTGAGEDLPARGRLWIEPGRGTVLRSETTFAFEFAGRRVARAYVATEYRREPRLAMWVPVEMREEYEDVPNAAVPLFRRRTVATARYGAFRRFTVSTQEEAHLPEEDPPPEL
jgi:VWFA-related protein